MAAPPITERHLPHFHRRAPFLEKCRAATTANITISTALNNGDVLDGVTLATGDRVLVKAQTAGSENGIYTVGVTPVRDYDVSTVDPNFGYLVFVTSGTVNAGTLWENTNTSAPTIDTTALTFAQVTSGSSLTIKDEGSTLDTAVTSIDFVGGGVTATNVSHAVTVTVPTPAATPTDHEHIMNLWFSGDGATTVFTLPAGAFDSQSVRVWVSGTLTDVTLSGTILDTMTFGSAPASATNNIVVDLVAAAA